MKIHSLGAVAGAALLLCSAAQAQSVTLYGGADANITRISGGGKSVTQLRDGGMYVTKLGIKGSEDLGGGYRAQFTLEGEISSDTGTGGGCYSPNNQASTGVAAGGGFNFCRQATLGLVTPAGELRMGRDYTATFVPATYFDPFFSAGVASATNFQAYYAPAPLHLPMLVRASNMLQLHLPSRLLPGFWGYAQHAFKEGLGADYTGIGTGYYRGPLLLSAAIGRSKNVAGTGYTWLNADTRAADNRLDIYSFGGSYDFSGFRVMGFYHAQKLKAFNYTGLPTERNRKADDLLLGFSWAIGVHTVKGSVLKRNDKGVANYDGSMTALGYSHHLSKRTALYANYARFSNKGMGNWQFAGSPLSTVPGGSSTALQTGISHSF